MQESTSLNLLKTVIEQLPTATALFSGDDFICIGRSKTFGEYFIDQEIVDLKVLNDAFQEVVLVKSDVEVEYANDEKVQYLKLKFTPILNSEKKLEFISLHVESSQKISNVEHGKFAIIANSIPALVSYIDVNLCYQFVNESYLKWFGMTSDQIIGRSMNEILGAKAASIVLPYAEAALRGNSVSFETRLEYREGGTREIIANYSPDFSTDGNVRGFIVLVQDITERKLVGRRVAESEERFRTVFSLAAVGIAMATVKGEILQANPAYCSITGYTQEELLKLTFADITHPDERQDNYKIIRKLLDDGTSGKIEEKRYVKKDGEIVWAQVTISVVRNEIGEAQNVITIIEDITERIIYRSKLQEALEATQLERTKLEKLTLDLQAAVTARDEFLSIASHELKTPLTSLKLQTQMAKRKASHKDSEEQLSPDKMLKIITQSEKQVERLTYLIDDMLDISRISTGKLTFRLEQFDMESVIHDVVERLGPIVEEASCEIQLQLKGPMIGIWDRDRIEQVFINLLSNAVRYGAGKPIKIIAEMVNNEVVVKVVDHGIGIAKSDLKRIFKLYERAISSNEVSGLGLGLFIVKEMVIRHSGSIDVESVEGLGSTFIVRLPHNLT